MTDFPDLKIKALVSFPAAVHGGTGISVSQDGGTYIFDFDYSELAKIASIPDAAEPTTYVALWEQTQDTYRIISVTDLKTEFGGGGSAPLPATVTPLVESGAGAVGVGLKYAREDHVHPAFGSGGGPMAAYTVKGNATAASATPTDLTNPILSGIQFGFTTSPNGTRIDARDSTLTNNTAVYTEAQRSVSSVVNDTVVTVNSVTANTQDAGAGRFIMRHLGTANSFPASTKGALIRSLEAHTLVDSSTPNDANRGTWIAELGLHSELAGNGVDKNVGIYLASSHTGWLSTGVRNDTALLITGADGWTNAILYLDTAGVPVFQVDQTGTVSAVRVAAANFNVTTNTVNAAAGCIGEYASASVAVGSATTLASVTPINLVSIPLTAGDWDVAFEPTFIMNPDGTTSPTQLIASISQTSATTDNSSGEYFGQFSKAAGAMPASVPLSVRVGPARKLLSATTTIYGVINSQFTGSAPTVLGTLRARRSR